MTPEEREAAKAKFIAEVKERYKNATPEEKAKMKEKAKEAREKPKTEGK
jgi:hypothetical protein